MYNALKHLETFGDIKRELHFSAVPFGVSGCMESQKVQLAAELGADYGWKIYITKDERSAQEVLSDFRNFEQNAWMYPAKDLLFHSSDVRGGYIVNERMDALRHLMEDKKGVLVLPVDALMDKISEREQVERAVLTLKEGMVFGTGKLSKLLTGLGYERVPAVERTGEYCIRGGICDIFPVSADQPVRVEFFDDEIDTIRSFETDSQRSIERLEGVTVYPADDSRKGSRTSLLSYFDKDAVLFLDEPARLRERAETVEKEFSESMERRLAAGKGSGDPGEADAAEDIFGAEYLFDALKRPRTVLLVGLAEGLAGYGAKKLFHLNTAACGRYRESVDMLVADLAKYRDEGWRVSILTPSHTRLSRLAENLREYGIRAYCPDEQSGELKPGEAEVVYGSLQHGFLYPDIRYALLTESDMFGSAGKKRRRRHERIKGEKLSSLTELSAGDYVVHESHGIGVYKGLEHIVREGSGKDYIKIEYADKGILYLPATRLDMVQKYAAGDAPKPKLSRLNGTEWQKTKKKVTASIEKTAKELIALYARRQRGEGFRYGPDTVWQREFEELFPYEETEDQVTAIRAVKNDMESGRIMDRLVCGDVGFGKTEIALRAAFKAVQDGRQVAYLVPTTILAEQHYGTFTERMGGFPVRVEVLSRFHTAAENKAIVNGLKAGTVDVVIGTHRLLSKDVGFKNLGLLIIDEEQRFGVTHKERLKQLKYNVDVLTLTATPIPRTLHMSLSGIRDLSILKEPPMERVPVQTYVMEYDAELVREAVDREAARGGQVFYVYNNVKGIADKTAQLQKLLPDLRIEFAHGQMNERELEEIMRSFVLGEIDVLVSTTIIETGLDIPNANTLIIDGAERMGLSQLYQIRGRVGRSNRTAYAFFMYRKDRILSEDAEKRLKAIREFAELGAGIKIAMRDLEIRGAGNVLGTEQHGQMEAIGYELYVKLLSRAVKLLSGEEEIPELFETSIDCDLDAFLPDTYVREESQRLDLYKRIAAITSEQDRNDLLDELIDRFGEPPQEAQNLLSVAMLKAEAHRACVTDLAVGRSELRMEMYPKAAIRVEAIPGLIAKEHGRLRFERGQKPRFLYRDPAHHTDASAMLAKAREIVGALVM